MYVCIYRYIYIYIIYIHTKYTRTCTEGATEMAAKWLCF